MQEQERELLTADELAKKLKVKKSAVRRWTIDGLPRRHLGGKLVRFEYASALAWLERRHQEGTDKDPDAA